MSYTIDPIYIHIMVALFIWDMYHQFAFFMGGIYIYINHGSLRMVDDMYRDQRWDPPFPITKVPEMPGVFEFRGSDGGTNH